MKVEILLEMIGYECIFCQKNQVDTQNSNDINI